MPLSHFTRARRRNNVDSIMVRALLSWTFPLGICLLANSQQHVMPHSLIQSPAMLLLLSIAPSSLPSISAARTSYRANNNDIDGRQQLKRTHYEVLEVPQDASLQDIKKAYRRLAVQHHPDRNPGNEEEATIKFREVSEAYEILSDEKSRREYDQFLKGESDLAFDGFERFSDAKFKWSTGGSSSGQRQRAHFRDPFAQFNDIFQNDPFFSEAFKSMDHLFEKTFTNFDSSWGSTSDSDSSSWINGGERMTSDKGRKEARDADNANNKKEGGGWWDTIKNWMPNIQLGMTTSSTGNGRTGPTTTYSSTSRNFGGRQKEMRSSSSYSTSRIYSNSGARSSTFTSRSTRTTYVNGQRVTIQSLERNGNRIEEKYIGDTLVERKINGLKADIGKIGNGNEF